VFHCSCNHGISVSDVGFLVPEWVSTSGSFVFLPVMVLGANFVGISTLLLYVNWCSIVTSYGRWTTGRSDNSDIGHKMNSALSAKCKEHASLMLECKEHASLMLECKEHASLMLECKEHASLMLECKEHTSLMLECKEHASLMLECKEHTSLMLECFIDNAKVPDCVRCEQLRLCDAVKMKPQHRNSRLSLTINWCN
jgi:hypothetical protein